MQFNTGIYNVVGTGTEFSLNLLFYFLCKLNLRFLDILVKLGKKKKTNFFYVIYKLMDFFENFTDFYFFGKNYGKI